MDRGMEASRHSRKRRKPRVHISIHKFEAEDELRVETLNFKPSPPSGILPAASPSLLNYPNY